jgi:hypothetical protein
MGTIEEELEAFKQRYAQRLQSELDSKGVQQPIRTQDYLTFKKQYMPKAFNWYEKACNWSEKVLKVAPDKKKVPELEEAIHTCHLNITPTGTMSFSFIAPIVIIFLSIIFGWMIPYVLSGGETNDFFFVMFGLITGMVMMIPLQKIPFMLANSWRMKASNQMVLCVFYIVTYMRHTSNLELAIDFAAEHLAPPLSFDLKLVIWNIETGKYDSIKESLDIYLQSWRKHNNEFIESIHLIQSSLYESAESRRLDTLDKSLKVMLDETYEKMLHFAHNLKGPLTTLHMMGIILPILGLVILPLVVSFMSEVKWYHLMILYNVALPGIVFYLARSILSSRPTGYGDTDITELNPSLKKYRSILVNVGSSEIKISPIILSVLVFVVFFIIGMLPIILWEVGGECSDIVIAEGGIMSRCNVKDKATITYALLEYRDELTEDGRMTGNKIGPYGLGAALLSLFIPLAFAWSFGTWHRLRSTNVIKIRRRAKQLEQEFASALFQLGNRLGDGYPAEIAFSKVADVMQGTVSGKFFELVSINIQKMGMGVEKAIFDPEQGALIYYPSNIIESSMKVLLESSKKGPLIASQALINVSEYIKQMHRVDERLRDLMADVISSMQSQIKFLTPAISGIVIGITSMITQIIGKLGESLKQFSEGSADAAMAGGGGSFVFEMFGNGVPTYFFQITVGLYVVQIIFILTILINGIENGADKLSERYMLGENLIKSTFTYIVIALLVMLAFSMVAGSITSSVNMSYM